MYYAFGSIFLLALLLIWIVRLKAPLWGLMDIPNARSIHVKQTPRGAGIGFFLAVALIFPLFYSDIMLSSPWIFIAVFLVFFIGVLDDHRDASPNTKFIVLIVSTTLLSLDGLLINDIGKVFGVAVSLDWFALPFTVFAVTGFTNALNLIDGLDGLAGTISIVILGTFFAVGYTNQDQFMMLLSGAFIAALIAFLIYNWNPASIFMGDSGSLTLGFVISILAIKSLNYVPAVSVLFLAAIPIFDTLVVMIRRKVNGVSMFRPDRCHLHHVLKHFFEKNIRRTVIFLGVFQLIYSLTGLQLDASLDQGYLLTLFILNVVLLYLFLTAMIKRQKREC